MHNKTILLYCGAIGILLTTSGCLRLPPYRMKRKKVTIALPAQCKQTVRPTTTDCVNNQIDVCPEIKVQPTITIWIHGTRLLPNPIFSAYMYSKPGLHPITVLDKTYHLRQLADAIIQADPERYPLDHFYAFGWSGKLSEQVRKDASAALHHQLLSLRQYYKNKHGVTPKIRLITHSHGGNIALHLVDMKTPTNSLEIEELILMACPVQEKTMHNIQDPMFKKTYALYSSMDMLQILAPQFLCRVQIVGGKKKKTELKIPLLSSRRFEPDAKLAQIKIKINGRALCHTTFSSDAFMRLLPTIIDEINHWQHEEQQYRCDRPDTRRLMSIYT